MSKPQDDLSYIRASLEELETYLLSKDLFWPVSTPAGMRTFPKLTLGNLLLAIKKLNAYTGPAVQREYSQITGDVEVIHNKWTTAWENKASREFGSRLRQWTHYLNDLQKNEETHAPYYPFEIRVRVLIALLDEFAAADDQQALTQLDVALQAKLTRSVFIWEPELQPEFPQDKFWFLYGKI
ncbi:MAG: hypothetical protein ABFS17_08545 [Chloroflexota bacterium]